MKDKTREEKDVQNYVAEDYEEKRYATDYSLIYQDWWSKKMVEMLKPQGKILDNGCGTGYFANRFLKGHNVTGVDFSEEMVKYARERMDNVICGDAQNLPLEDNTFDTVIVRSLLHHLSDPRKGVSEIERVLKNGGRVIFVETISSLLSSLPRKFFYKKSRHFSREHKNFREKELLEIIATKLKIEKKQYFGYLAYPLLGFPDILDLYKYIPLKSILTPLLIKLDEIIAKIPLIKKQAWGIMILATKK